MTMSQQQKPIKKKSEKTKRYDEIAGKINKLLMATGATYIPELCDALREDWFPTMTDEQFQDPVHSAIRKEMREKILDEWSKERGANTKWSDEYITDSFRDWLKNPIQAENTRRSNEAKSRRKFFEKVEGHKKAFDRMVEQLPEIPREEQKPTFEITDNSQISRVDDEPLLRKLGDQDKSAIAAYGDIFGPLQDLLNGLVGNPVIPGSDEDRFNEYIKPARERFNSIIYEIDERMRTDLFNGLAYLLEVCEDFIGQIKKVEK